VKWSFEEFKNGPLSPPLPPIWQEAVRPNRYVDATGAESWATRGETVSPVIVDGIRVGLLICADVFTAGPAMLLKDQGAEILVSAAAWGPGDWEPNGEWEARSQETGLPLLVCNRAGLDATRSFDGAESVIAKDGARVLSFQAVRSTLFLVDWDLRRQAPVSTTCPKELEGEIGLPGPGR
jgi:predicted amidohydrolase